MKGKNARVIQVAACVASITVGACGGGDPSGTAFTIAATPTTITCAPSAQVSLGAAVQGAAGIPSFTFTPSSPVISITASGGTATVRCMAAGPAFVTVTASAGGITRETTVPVTVTATTPVSTGIALRVDAAGAVIAGERRPTIQRVGVAREGGYGEPVTLSVEGLPAGVVPSFSPNPVTGAQSGSDLTLTPDLNATPGTYTLVVRARATGLPDQTAAMPLLMGATSSFIALVQVHVPSAMTVGQTTQVQAIAYDVTGGIVRSRAPWVWTLSDSTVATLAADGTLRAVRVGDVSVRAMTEGRTGGALLPIRAASAPAFALSTGLAGTTMPAGGAAVDVALGIARSGGFTAPVALSLEGAPAGVSGTFTPQLADGSATLRLSAGTTTQPGNYVLTIRGRGTGVTDQTVPLALTVQAAPQVARLLASPTELQFGRTVTYANVLPTARVHITSSNGAVSGPLTVDCCGGDGAVIYQPTTTSTNGDGSFDIELAGYPYVGREPGVYRASAVVRSSRSDVAPVTIALTFTLLRDDDGIASISVSPSNAAGVVGASQTFNATTRDANGNVNNRYVTWSSSNTAVARVSTYGWNGSTIEYVGAGQATITASGNGRTGSASVSVSGGGVPVQSVTVSPASVTLGTGGTQQFTATLRDGAGNDLTGRGTAWTSSNTTVLSVDQSGLARAVSAGPATVTASSEGHFGSASVAVTNAAAPTPGGTWNGAPYQSGGTQGAFPGRWVAFCPTTVSRSWSSDNHPWFQAPPPFDGFDVGFWYVSIWDYVYVRVRNRYDQKAYISVGASMTPFPADVTDKFDPMLPGGTHSGWFNERELRPGALACVRLGRVQFGSQSAGYY